MNQLNLSPFVHGEWEPCDFCNGEKTLYQETIYTKMFINTFGNKTVIEIECNRCPPYSRCSMKDIPVRSAFIIDYCPNCGRPFTKEAEEKLKNRMRGA